MSFRTVTMKMAGKKVWRDAATLILTAKSDKTGIAKRLASNRNRIMLILPY